MHCSIKSDSELKKEEDVIRTVQFISQMAVVAVFHQEVIILRTTAYDKITLHMVLAQP